MEPSSDLDVLEQRYRRFLVDQYARLTFKGISRSGKAISLPLEDVYVELKAVADVPDAADAYSAEERRLLLEAEARGQRDTEELRVNLDSIRYERWRAEGRAGHARFERRSIEASITGAGRPGVVILGDPGSGKSTLLRYLALCAAREGLAGGAAPPAPPVPPERPRLPILVPLAAYDDWVRRNQSALSIHDFLPLYFDKWHSLPGLGPVFRRAFDAGRALVLLDGLDEVLDVAARRHVAGQARALIQHEIGRGNRFAVTSRIVGYREAPLPGDLPHVTVLDFGPDEIETFSRKWCEACEVWLAGERTEVALQRAAAEAKALLDEVRSNPSVLRLAANPLLLTMLALLRRAGGRLPDQRIRLYERYIDTLLDNNWENVRSDGARTREPERFPLALAQSYLMELALWLQRHKPSGTARRRELEAALEGIALRHDGIEPLEATRKERQQAQEKAALFLKDMRHFAGLLAERGQDAFGFLHLTFQEYFVGRALARMDDAEARWALVKEHLHRPRWREPLLLCAGQLGIIEGRSRAASDYVRRILGAGSPHEEILHRDAFLAAAVAADDVGLEPRLLEEIAGRLIELTGSKVPRVRVEALRGLGQLARIGHEAAATWLEERIRRREEPEEVAEALEGVLGEASCSGLLRAICEWANDEDYPIGASLIRALNNVVPTNEQARSVVVAKINDKWSGVRHGALRALQGLVVSDGEVRELVLSLLGDQSADMRRAAIGALSGPIIYDEKVRSVIIAKLDDEQSMVRRRAVSALGILIASDEKVRDIVTAKLGDEDHSVRRTAIGALGRLVQRDETVRRLLVPMLHEQDSSTRMAAIHALGGLVATEDELRKLIIANLDDEAIHVRRAAAGALGALVASDEVVRGYFIAKLEERSCAIAHHMISALGGLVASDEVVRDLVLAKLDDQDPLVRRAAIGAVVGLLENDPRTRGVIVAKLNDQADRVRRAAVDALGDLAITDAKVRDLICAKVDDGSENVRRTAIGALRKFVSTDAKVRSIVIAKIDDDATDVRHAAIRAIGRLAACDKSIRDIIVARVHDINGLDRAASVASLVYCLPGDREAREIVISALGDRRLSVREAAVGALGRLVPCDEDARGTVISILDDQNWRMRSAAVRALKDLLKDDGRLRETVLEKLDDVDPYVCQASIDALQDLVVSDEHVRDLVLSKVDSSDFGIRLAAVSALAPVVEGATGLEDRLLPWLGVVAENVWVQAAERARHRLARGYASVLSRDSRLLNRVKLMLCSCAWPERAGAALTFIYMPGGPPKDVMPVLRNLLDDHRAEESWQQRLQAASFLINDRESRVSRGAIAAAVEALDYAVRPWYDLQHGGSMVRAQAVEILGELEPSYRDDAIFARMARIISEEDDRSVLDAAYQALLRLTVAPEAEHDVETWLSSSSSSSSEPSKQPIPIPILSSPADLMPPLPSSAVLHLSDLHFGTPQEADTWYSQLADDLRHELGHDRLDAAILSGDIANRSTPDEYAAARRFLEKLAAEFHISPAQIILVPGNHDLNWGLARNAYKLHERDEHAGKLVDGRFIPVGDDAVRLRDDALYPKRFEPFAAFYEAAHGKPYPLDPAEQGLLYHLPAQNLLVLGLNSAWQLDHHFKARASINAEALSHALDQIRREPAYAACLKIAVWHHPIHSAFEDRITDAAFLDRLASAGFRLGLHGHIHKAQSNLFRYDLSPAGRRIDLVCAGTFGAPTREWVPGYPLQYQLLRFEGNKVTVETRRREDRDGAWKPDARWTAERGKDPAPRYEIPLFAGGGGT